MAGTVPRPRIWAVYGLERHEDQILSLSMTLFQRPDGKLAAGRILGGPDGPWLDHVRTDGPVIHAKRTFCPKYNLFYFVLMIQFEQ